MIHLVWNKHHVGWLTILSTPYQFVFVPALSPTSFLLHARIYWKTKIWPITDESTAVWIRIVPATGMCLTHSSDSADWTEWLTLALLHDVDGAHQQLDAVVAAPVAVSEQHGVAVALRAHVHTLAAARHAGGVELRQRVGAVLEAVPLVLHHLRHRAAAWQGTPLWTRCCKCIGGTKQLEARELCSNCCSCYELFGLYYLEDGGMSLQAGSLDAEAFRWCGAKAQTHREDLIKNDKGFDRKRCIIRTGHSGKNYRPACFWSCIYHVKQL